MLQVRNVCLVLFALLAWVDGFPKTLYDVKEVDRLLKKTKDAQVDTSVEVLLQIVANLTSRVNDLTLSLKDAQDFRAFRLEELKEEMIAKGIIPRPQKEKGLKDFLCSADAGSQCPNDWCQLGEQCYMYNRAPMNWTASREVCRQNGGDLTTPKDAKELFHFPKFHPVAAANTHSMWLGASDKEQEGTWLWVDGRALNLSEPYWIVGEPNNNEENEHCLLLLHFRIFNDEACDKEYSFMCQMKLESA